MIWKLILLLGFIIITAPMSAIIQDKVGVELIAPNRSAKVIYYVAEKLIGAGIAIILLWILEDGGQQIR